MKRIAALTDIFGGRGGADRLHLIDAARGLAIVAMVVFHIAWDLFYFGFISVNVIEDLGWVLFQRAIVSAFLLLVGAGLVLGHGDVIRWPSFLRRFAVIAVAALLTSIGTWAAFGAEYFVYFGILHAIALFSLAGLAFLRLPAGLVAGLGLFVIVLPGLFSHPVMREKALSWIGLWPLPPATADIVPVFPWFGVVLIGIAGIRVLRRSPDWPRLAGVRLDGVAGRTLRGMGRWSLVIYLVHQPIIYGGLSLLAG